jgi:hypothetical protein
MYCIIVTIRSKLILLPAKPEERDAMGVTPRKNVVEGEYDLNMMY